MAAVFLRSRFTRGLLFDQARVGSLRGSCVRFTRGDSRGRRGRQSRRFYFSRNNRKWDRNDNDVLASCGNPEMLQYDTRP